MKVLGAEEVRFYQRFGYLLLDSFIALDWLKRLDETTTEFIEESRCIDQSNASILVEPTHTRTDPHHSRTVNAT